MGGRVNRPRNIPDERIPLWLGLCWRAWDTAARALARHAGALEDDPWEDDPGD